MRKAMLLAVAVLLALPLPARALEGAGALELGAFVDGRQLAPGATVQLDGLSLARLDLSCDPPGAEVGVSCGMEGMCGLDPCLCGSPDRYGACACNGTEEAVPAFEVESGDSGCVSVVRLGPSLYIAALMPGETTLRVSATLQHHDDAAVTWDVAVAPAPAGRVAALSGVLLAVLVLACLAVRALARRRKGGGAA